MADRTVHAESNFIEVVRYERSGKWFVEAKPPRRFGPELVTVHDAARIAWNMVRNGRGKVIIDAPGGRTFRRIYRGLAS